VRRAKAQRSLTGAQEKDQLLLELFAARAPYEDFKHALLGLEKRWLREARTPSEVLEIRRGIAEDLLSQSFRKATLAPEFLRNLRRVRRLGFSNLSTRVHVTCMFVQSLPYLPRCVREAWALLLETEGRVRRLRRASPPRAELVEALAHAKREVGWPLSPEEEACLRERPSLRTRPTRVGATRTRPRAPVSGNRSRRLKPGS
jgi:hypothetical protein